MLPLPAHRFVRGAAFLEEPSGESVHSAATEDLVSAARAGNTAAEEMLYARHAPDVYRVASRLLGSPDEAADVMQDTFVAVFEELGALRDPSAFRSWVLQISVRLVHRRFRRRKLARLLGFHGHHEQESLENLAHVDAGAEARAELRLVDTALRKLHHEERTAWILRHIEGFELTEVGALLSCSLATAKRRLARAEQAMMAFWTEAP